MSNTKGTPSTKKSDNCSKCSFMHKAEEKCLKWDHPNGKSMNAVKKLLAKDEDVKAPKVAKSEFALASAKAKFEAIKERIEKPKVDMAKSEAAKTLSYRQMQALEKSDQQFICASCEKKFHEKDGEYTKVADVLRDDPKAQKKASENLDKDVEVMTCKDCAKAHKSPTQ